MRADFAIVVDACVLAEAAVSDLFLRLAEEPRLVLPRWSEPIWEETRRTWINVFNWSEEIAESRIRAAVEFFPEAMILNFEHLIPQCENHPKDRHVLAAAIHSGTDTIVTFNLKDFSPEATDKWGVTAIHPAEYLKILFDLDSAAVTNALHSMANRANRSVPELLGRLAWYVRPFAEHVSIAYASQLPEITPQDWRR